MTLISDGRALAAFCDQLRAADAITVDTEFLREATYWPRLCLVQVAGPHQAAAIDPLASGMDLAPLFELLADRRILKVFHSARQDIEIFYQLMGTVPAPLFDTQIAAMVCGFGDQVGYDVLVAKLTGTQIDKLSRFTDWSLRPLRDAQLRYALADVTHMREVYERLRVELAANGRAGWLAEEMALLSDPATYALEPDDAWRRLKPRTTRPRYLAILREVAAWREREAQRRDVPRGRVLRDEALTEIAATAPEDAAALARTRALSAKLAAGPMGAAILAAVARGRATPPEGCPRLPSKTTLPPGLGPVVELLKVLLKMKCEEHHVAPRLVASAADLHSIAADDAADVPALGGWRRELFGADALALKAGRFGLSVEGRKVRLVRR